MEHEDFLSRLPDGDEAPTPSVLVVEDEAPLRALYQKMLCDAGFRVQGAQSVAEARARLAEDPHPWLVVSDLWLPDGDAFDVLPLLKGDTGTPFLLLTGGPTIDSAINAIERGVYRYLCKPVSEQRLIAEATEAARIHAVARLQRQVIGARVPSAAPAPLASDANRAWLDEALDQLWLAAQPIVRVSDRSVYAYEVLLRSGSSRLTNPGQIIELAEREGRLPELGHRVRLAAAARIAELPPTKRLFVNLHPADLTQSPGLWDAADPLLPHADQVTLELTERARLDGVAGVDAAVRQLRAAGYQIALDDLGSGYSGLTCLANLSPHVVKLDMSLVRNIERDRTRVALVRAMVELCRELGVEVIAEGVETPAERDALVALGCDLLQGYHFARPGAGFPSVPASLFGP
jgi:EAL domain-containing protein (putative c-di-GMP-specific phosphodiesterase class I)/ActR/RegA family two-component response regulator